MLQVVVFLALAFSIVIALFAVQNTTPVTVSFLFFQARDVPVSILVLIAAALGAGIMLLLGLAREIRVQLRARSLRKQVKTAENRVQALEAQVAPAVPVATVEDVTAPSVADTERGSRWLGPGA